MPEIRIAVTGRRALGAAAGVLLTSALLAGCGGGDDKKEPQAAPSQSQAPARVEKAATKAEPMHRSLPATIKIPKIGVSAPVGSLGLQPDGRIEEPPLEQPNLTGWFKNGPTPGELGPSVVLGHVDAHKKAAVFYRLNDLKPGDKIQVTRKDGTTATFAVQRTERVSKDAFPNKKVYGEDLDYAALRLVTCGGTFSQQTGHYVDNLIVYSRQIAT